MKNKWLFFLLLPPVLVVLLVLAAVFFTALALLPPWVSGVAVFLLLVVGAWLILGRQKSGPVSEGSLLGRQKSVEGLL